MLAVLSRNTKALITLLSFSIFSYTHAIAPMPPQSILPPDTYFLSYPRSGKNLTTSYLQALTDKPIRGFPPTLKLDETELDLNVNYFKQPIMCMHSIEHLLNKNNKLLLIVRNYKECLLRHLTESLTLQSVLPLFLQNEKDVLSYVSNLISYDTWNPEKRLMIYYEDLIADPITEMTKVLDFLEEPINENFNESYLKEVFKESVIAYDHRYETSGGSHTKGKNMTQHSDPLPLFVKQKIDQHMKTTFPRIWHYISRYESVK